jgi:hypothetical protein
LSELKIFGNIIKYIKLTKRLEIKVLGSTEL